MRPFYSLLIGCTLLTACHSKPDLIPQASQYHYNGETGERHDAFATYVVRTSASSLGFSAKTSYVAPYIAGATITALIDGRPDSTFTLVATNKEQYFSLQLPKGKHQVSLVEGAQIRPNEQGEVLYAAITGLTAPGGQALTVVPPRHSKEGIVVFGDSRTVGGAGNKTSQDAWPVQLRELRRADVYATGYASMQLGAHINTAARQDSLTQEVMKRLVPYSTKILYVEAGVNDYLSATYSPAQLTTYYQQWLPKVHQAIPGVRIFVQTDLYKKGEGPNKLGFTLQQYRLGEAAGAGGVAIVVDGRLLADSTTLQDGVHQTAAGDAGIAVKVNAVLGPSK